MNAGGASRRVWRWAHGAVLGLALVACGGAAENVDTGPKVLPPADPEAVRELAQGVRKMDRRAAAARRQARAHFERALEIDPTLWEAHYDLGVMDRRDGDLHGAAERFERALAIQPTSRRATLALAEVRRALGERGAAADLLRRFLAEHATGAEEDADEEAALRVTLAVVERERGEHRAALAAARDVLIRDPQNVAALAEVGRVYRARGQRDVAELVFRKALDIDPESAVLRNDLGLLALDRGDTQAAFLALAEAIDEDPAYAPARLNQGAVLLRAGDYAGAETQYRAVLDADGDDLDAKVGLAIALRGQGEHRRARRLYQEVLEANPSHAAATLNLAVLKAEFLDERPEARSLFARYLELAPRGADRERAMAERYLEEIAAPAEQTVRAP